MSLKLIFTKARLKIAWTFNDMRGRLGWKGSPIRPMRRILMYHGIDKRGETQLNSRYLSKSELRKHFTWLAKECQVISLKEYFSKPQAGSKPEICLTFDDGYLNNFTEVFPLLKEFDFPATIFVTAASLTGREILWTDLLDLDALLNGKPLEWEGEGYARNGKSFFISMRNAAPLKAIAKQAGLAQIEALEAVLMERAGYLQDKDWQSYWGLMREDELREMGQHALLELGVHGTTHCSLGALAPEKALAELVAGKQWLEQLCGAPVTALSWPSGSYTPELVVRARAAGFDRMLAGNFLHEGDKQDTQQAERLVINPHISFLNQREAILKGGYL